ISGSRASGARSRSAARAPPEGRTLHMGGEGHGQAAARPRFHGAVQGAPPRRLLVLLLPDRQPPRRRGPDRADLPAGVPPLRARAARVERAAAASLADPDRPQPRRQLLPRPLAAAGDPPR